MAKAATYKIEYQLRNNYGPNDWTPTRVNFTTVERAQARAEHLLVWGPEILSARVLESRSRRIVATIAR